MNAVRFPRARKTGLALAVMTAMCGSANAATMAGNLATVAHPTVLARGDQVTGMLPSSQPLQIVVGLKLHDRAGLDAFINANTKVQSAGGMPQLMGRDEFLARHAPTTGEAQAVAAYLTRMGFTNVVIAPNRMLVSADGTAATASNAFLTSFSRVRTHDGRTAFANNSDAFIPAALRDKVEGVIGLQTVHMARTFSTTHGMLPAKKTGASTQVAPPANNLVFMYQYPSLYGTLGSNGANATTVGILTTGDLTNTLADLNDVGDGSTDRSLNCYYSNTGFAGAGGGVCHNVATKVVNVGVGPWTGTTDDVEWHLDSQAIAGMVGQYATPAKNKLNLMMFYNIPSLLNTNLILDINQAVVDNKVKVFNGSVGECEMGAAPVASGGDGSAAVADAIMAAGVAQGQTFAWSTGDFGADECRNGGVDEPSWPANSQYAIAVAGTTLATYQTSTGTPVNAGYGNETVWASSGGSQSTYEPKPSWQTAWSGPRRGVADVAYNASDLTYTIVYIADGPSGPGNYFVSGTSVSAPLFSGLWASVLTKLGNGYGFAGPIIYQLPAADFHDVTSGNNVGETAAVGYDLASGRGSLRYDLAVVDGKKLGNKAPVENFSFATAGLSASFTDAAADPDGTVQHWKWNFGDGSATTAVNAQQNPVHVFAADGTYKVTEAAYDNDGKAATASKLVVVTSAAGPQDLLANGGFESGSSPWTVSSNPAHAVVDCSDAAEPASTGSCDAYLDGVGASHSDTLTQMVSLPTGKTSATLAFALHVDSADTTGNAHDKLRVKVMSSSGALLATLATYSNVDAASGYVTKSLDLSAYLGQTVKIEFSGIENATLKTSFVIDDVTLTVN